MLVVPVRSDLILKTSAQIGAAGTGTAPLSGGGSAMLRVRQVSVELAAAPAGSTCALRLNGFLVTPLVPTGDASAGDPPVLVSPGDELTVEWTGCTPGTVGRVLMIYDEVVPR